MLTLRFLQVYLPYIKCTVHCKDKLVQKYRERKILKGSKVLYYQSQLIKDTVHLGQKPQIQFTSILIEISS